ncbi:HNH endonuclease [Gemmatimonas sp.]
MLSQRLRFSILHRDRFTCRYCGVRASHRQLEVDHVVPVSKGGRNDPANLVTACIACNQGKSNRTLVPTIGTVDSLYQRNVERIPHYHASPVDDSGGCEIPPWLPLEGEQSVEHIAIHAVETALCVGLPHHLGMTTYDPDSAASFQLDMPIPVAIVDAVLAQMRAWSTGHTLRCGDVTDLVLAALDTTVRLLGHGEFLHGAWSTFERTMCLCIKTVFTAAACAWTDDRWSRDAGPSEHLVDALHPTTGTAHRITARSLLDYAGYARVRVQ